MVVLRSGSAPSVWAEVWRTQAGEESETQPEWSHSEAHGPPLGEVGGWGCSFHSSFPLTREVVELMQSLHDDRDERQVELSNMTSDLRVPVATVCIMAAQQGVNSTDRFFMEEENPVDRKNRW